MHKIIDTHSHLYSHKFDKDQDAAIKRAQDVLQAVFLPNINRESVEAMHALTEKNPRFFFPMIGLHPSDVKEAWATELTYLKSLLDDPDMTYYGIGETGIDLYWDKSTFEWQKASLIAQIQWAKETGLPIILHAREAIDETADIIEAHMDENLKGIFHCFDGNFTQAQRIMDFGSFKLGIGGIVTYRKDVQATVKEVPMEYIVLETDSPYLPPEPHRKDKPRRNESSYTTYVAQKIADLKGVTYDEVASVTNQNASRLFPEALSTLVP
ncbi:MAG: TatD family hydrolase [Bacteroidota bacterium]